MNIISVSYGNDSIALIQWAHENNLEDAHVVYCDTGWAHPSWPDRVSLGMTLAKMYGFKCHNVVAAPGFADMVRMKKGFPFNGAQFCTGILKWLPFSEWCADHDPDSKATLFIGKRRSESKERAKTPLWLFNSELHEGRDVCHPLYKLADEDRNEYISRSGMPLLPHRSKECSPCVNANRADFKMVAPEKIAIIRNLENEVGQNMFRAYRHMGAAGIDEVMRWANSARGKYNKDQYDIFECASGMCS